MLFSKKISETNENIKIENIKNNFVFIEHIDKLRNFDERKIVYASVNK